MRNIDQSLPLVSIISPLNRKVTRSCKFPGCEKKCYTPIDENMKNPRFHRFPRDNKNHRAWKNVCQIESSINCSHFYVCDDHFVEIDYFNHLKQRGTFNAVPSASKKTGDEKSTVLSTYI